MWPVRKSLYLLGVVCIVFSAIAIAMGQDNKMFVNPEELTINWTAYDGKTVEYYIYEDGVWVKKEMPVIWWRYVELKDVKIHFPNSKATYGNVVGMAISVRKAKGISTYGGSFIDPDKGILFVYVGNEDDGRKILNMV